MPRPPPLSSSEVLMIAAALPSTAATLYSAGSGCDANGRRSSAGGCGSGVIASTPASQCAVLWEPPNGNECVTCTGDEPSAAATQTSPSTSARSSGARARSTESCEPSGDQAGAAEAPPASALIRAVTRPVVTSTTATADGRG